MDGVCLLIYDLCRSFFHQCSYIYAHILRLHRIQRCSHINQMSAQKLACVFSSCLFQTEGHTAQETRVVEDLINNYIQLFSVSSDLLDPCHLIPKGLAKCETAPIFTSLIFIASYSRYESQNTFSQCCSYDFTGVWC